MLTLLIVSIRDCKHDAYCGRVYVSCALIFNSIYNKVRFSNQIKTWTLDLAKGPQTYTKTVNNHIFY